MLTLILNLIFSAIFASVLQNPAAVPDETCGRLDDYDTPVRVSSEAFKYGKQCLNTAKFRALKILEESATSIKAANFYHDHEHYIATIDLRPESIEHFYFQALPFNVLPGVTAGHVQVRFVYKKGYGIQLINQKDASKQLTVDDVIISYEAALTEGAEYNFALGAMKAYPLVARVLSGLGKLHDTGPKREFDQYEINVTPDEQSQLLRHYLKESDRRGLREYYHTADNNCASNAFNGLESLERLKDQQPKFQTMIAGDPVIGPTVKVLTARRIVRQRVQDMRDEKDGKFYTRKIEVPGDPEFPLFAKIPGLPVTLLMVQSDSDQLTPTQKQTVMAVRDAVLAELPNALNSTIGALAMMTEISDGIELLAETVTKLMSRLEVRLKENEKNLPEYPYLIQYYLLPLNSDKSGFESIAHKTALPIQLFRTELKKKTIPDIYARLRESLRLSELNQNSALPVGLKAVLVRLNVQKGQGFAQVQVLGGLQAREEAIDVKNEQVNLSKFILPSMARNQHRSSALLTYTQGVGAPLNDRVNVAFGEDIGLAGDLDSAEFGRMRMHVQTNECLYDTFAMPTLKGTLTDKATGSIVDKLFEGKSVSFHVLSADMDIDDLRVENLKLGVDIQFTSQLAHATLGALGLTCNQVDSVNEQFSREINEKLKPLRERVHAN